jgi:hypothetical protein
VPVTVTAVPPQVEPLLGLTPLTVGAGGGATYVKPAGSVPLCPPEFVTTTLTAPAARAGVVAVIEVLFTTTTLVAAAPPKLTPAPAAKPVPVMVTAVPPLVGPELGLTRVTVGGGGGGAV